MLKLLGFLLMLGLASPAMGSHEEYKCLAESDLAYNLAVSRDGGVPIEEFYRAIKDIEDMDKEDKRILVHNVDIIYNNPGIDPDMFLRTIYRLCITHKYKT